MLEILKFIFSGFFIWLGTLILILAITEVFSDLIKLFKKDK